MRMWTSFALLCACVCVCVRARASVMKSDFARLLIRLCLFCPDITLTLDRTDRLYLPETDNDRQHCPAGSNPLPVENFRCSTARVDCSVISLLAGRPWLICGGNRVFWHSSGN